MAYKAIQGDIIWLTLDPQSGHEQKGRRPSLVVSNNSFNTFARHTAMVCPIISTNKDIPLHVRLDTRTITNGVILCDQAKILDIVHREAEFIEKVPLDLLLEVIDIIQGIIEVEEE